MNSGHRTKRRRLSWHHSAATGLAGLLLVLLTGCHYSLLNRSSSLAAWSPDGTQLAVCIANGDTGSSDLWLINPDEGSARRLLSAPAPSQGPPHLLAPRWSPDGGALFCARTDEGDESDRRPATIIRIGLPGGQTTEAGTINYSGSRSTYFADSDVFVPLSDGTLAVQDLGKDQRWRLARLDPVTGRWSAFAGTGGRRMSIRGTPSGTLLAVAGFGPHGSTPQVSVHRADGTRLPHTLTLWETGGDGILPSLTWSPSGDRLGLVIEDIPPPENSWRLPFFSTTDPEEDFATLMLFEPFSGTTATLAHDVFGIAPVFSPDGTMLAYAADAGIRSADGDLLLEVRAHGPGATDDGEISLPGLALPLVWSADGCALAYYLGLPDDDTRGTVISVSADGSGTTVAARKQQDRLAVPSPRGDRLAWVSRDGAVQVLDPFGGGLLYGGGLTCAGTVRAAEDQLGSNRPGEALSLLDRMEATGPDSDVTGRRAAVRYAALRRLDRPADADTALDNACIELQRAENPARALFAFCGSLSDAGFRGEAERLVENRLLARYPDSPEAVEALWALAALRQSEGDTEAALRDLGQLLRDHPGERGEASRAVLLAALADAGGDPAAVVPLAELVIEGVPEEEEEEKPSTAAAARCALGLALEAQGLLVEAREAFAAALAEQSGAALPDGRRVEALCRGALVRLADQGFPAGGSSN